MPTSTAKHFTTDRLLQAAGVLAWALSGWLAWNLGAEGGSGRWLTLALLALYLGAFLLATNRQSARQHRSRCLAALAVQAVVALSLMLQVGNPVISVLFIVTVSQLPAFFSLRVCLVAVVGFLLGLLGLSALVWQEPNPLFKSLLYTSLMLFAVFTADQARREQRGREELTRLNGELRATQHLLSDTARQSERLSIARDLHDTLGHHLTALSIQLQIASHLCEGTGKIQVEKAQQVAKLLLADVRAAVSELRESSALDLRAALAELLAGVPNLAVRLEMSVDFRVDDAARAETLLRAAQEAITNTLRHADASELLIRLYQEGECLYLEARDNGRGTALLQAGNGLRGLKERVQALGGRFSVDSAPGDGFAVRLELPERGA
ncbi:sensor histidine kinase [Pseudomonas cavernicola]|nr:sensor histidine kinase [Pseudomonas cavernicola]